MQMQNLGAASNWHHSASVAIHESLKRFLIIRECDCVHVPINKVVYTHQDRMGGDLSLRGSIHVHSH